MATNVTLPALGESVSEGTIVAWLKKVGDNVALDEPLLEVSTDKIDTEIPSPAAGVILELAAQEDDVVQVGGLLAVIGTERDAAAQNTAPVGSPPPRTAPAPVPAPSDSELVSANTAQVTAAPVATRAP